LVLYKTSELCEQEFDFSVLTWVELWGFEPQTSCMP
jgi:hypothetical protein